MASQDVKAKAAREISLISVKLEGERRPMLLETILEAGVKALRPNASDDQRRAARLALIDGFFDLMERLQPTGQGPEIAAMRKRLTELEARFKADPVFTVAEAMRVRALHEFGVAPREIAALFDVQVQAVRRTLKKQEMVRLPPRPIKTRSPRGRRILDVG
jgi:hypothetical protein